MRKKDTYAKALVATAKQINQDREMRMLESATVLFLSSISMALIDKHRFGKKRLESTLKEVCDNIAAVRNDQCSMEDMVQTVKKATGVDIYEILGRVL